MEASIGGVSPYREKAKPQTVTDAAGGWTLDASQSIAPHCRKDRSRCSERLINK